MPPRKRASKKEENSDDPEDFEMVNYDHVIPKDLGIKTRQSKYKWAPRHPGRFMIVAPSGYGKSNLLLNLLMKVMVYDKLYLLVQDATEDKYLWLQEKFREVVEAMNEQNETSIKLEDIFKMTTELKDLPDLETMDKTKQTVVVFDDQVVKKDQSKIMEFFIRARKKNCSCIYLSQSFFDVPKIIRLNINYVYLFTPGNKRELNEIAKTYASDLEFKDFRKLFMACVEKPYGFLSIDLTRPASQLDKKYSCGLGNNYAVFG